MSILERLYDARPQRRFVVGLALLFAAIVGNAPAAEESEFDKYLKGEPYDERKLLSELPDDPNTGFSPARDAVTRFEISSIALILPLDAGGYVGEAASAFLEGFIQAAEREGLRQAVETYRTDGHAHSGLAAYQQAVADGAGFVVGPLLRSSVERVATLPASRTVPTVMLQEPSRAVHAGQLGAPALYSFPLGGEGELIQFLRLAPARPDSSVHVVVEDSDLGRRLARALERMMAAAGLGLPSVHTVVSNESWVDIHGQISTEIEPLLLNAADLFESADDPRLKARHAVVFAAGGAEFASQTRANVPGAVPIYVLAAAQDGLEASGRNLLGQDGLRYYEMPYVVDLADGKDVLGSDYAGSLQRSLQRYMAAGIDAYQIVAAYPQWGQVGSWAHSGATGELLLDGGRFIRLGKVLEIRDGVRTDISPVPADDENCEDDGRQAGCE